MEAAFAENGGAKHEKKVLIAGRAWSRLKKQDSRTEHRRRSENCVSRPTDNSGGITLSKNRVRGPNNKSTGPHSDAHTSHPRARLTVCGRTRACWPSRHQAGFAPVRVFFSHGQGGDQFPKTDRAFCHLDVRRMLAATGFLRPLRVDGFLMRRIRTITMLC